MPLTNLNIGAAPNDGTGETLRSGGAKINTNYTFTVTTDTTQTITGAKTFQINTNSTDTAASANYPLIVKNNNTTNNTLVGIAFNTNAGTGAVIASVFPTASSNSNSQLLFQTRVAGTIATRMTIGTDGNVGIGLAPTNRNNTRLQLDAGIGFPATKVPSTDANTLDDYEEGTWTPTLFGTTTAGTGTYVVNIGRYTLIGNVCYFDLIIVCTAHTATGNVRVNLPFASTPISPGLAGSCGGGFTSDIDYASGTAIACQAGLGTTTMGVFSYGDNVALANITDFVGGYVLFGHFYV
jgi:hypothetical protein